MLNNQITIVRDTRDKTTKHKNLDIALAVKGYRVVRSKMYVGDVTLLNNQSVCIDLKRDLEEVSSNLFAEHDRFVAELQRAKEAGIKLYILVEDGSVSDWDDVIRWESKRKSKTPMTPNGARIYRMVQALENKYGCQFVLCHREQTIIFVETILGLREDEQLCMTKS